MYGMHALTCPAVREGDALASLVDHHPTIVHRTVKLVVDSLPSDGAAVHSPSRTKMKRRLCDLGITWCRRVVAIAF